MLLLRETYAISMYYALRFEYFYVLHVQLAVDR